MSGWYTLRSWEEPKAQGSFKKQEYGPSGTNYLKSKFLPYYYILVNSPCVLLLNKLSHFIIIIIIIKESTLS